MTSSETPTRPHPGFLISLGDVDLSIAEIWPDGDAPANPTCADVIEQMKQAGSPSRVISEWNLMPDGLEVMDQRTAESEVYR